MASCILIIPSQRQYDDQGYQKNNVHGIKLFKEDYIESILGTGHPSVADSLSNYSLPIMYCQLRTLIDTPFLITNIPGMKFFNLYMLIIKIDVHAILQARSLHFWARMDVARRHWFDRFWAEPSTRAVRSRCSVPDLAPSIRTFPDWASDTCLRTWLCSKSSRSERYSDTMASCITCHRTNCSNGSTVWSIYSICRRRADRSVVWVVANRDECRSPSQWFTDQSSLSSTSPLLGSTLCSGVGYGSTWKVFAIIMVSREHINYS